jgi:heat shock protein HtpX
MVYEAIEQNKRSTFFLVFFFILIISGLGYLIGELYKNPYTGLIIAFCISLFSVWTSYYFSDSLIMAVSGAVEADRAMYTQYILSTEGLSLAAGIKIPKTYILNSPCINAFATGRDLSHAAICITTGAFEKLTKTELEGVLGHEMSHIINYDILTGAVSAVLVGMTVILADIIKRNIFRSSMARAGERRGLFFIIGSVIVAVLAPYAALIISYAVSRQREYLADAQSVLLTRYPQGLIGALEKIKKDFAPAPGLYQGMEHLYISNPFKMDGTAIFATHPPLDDRINRLKSM